MKLKSAAAAPWWLFALAAAAAVGAAANVAEEIALESAARFVPEYFAAFSGDVRPPPARTSNLHFPEKEALKSAVLRCTQLTTQLFTQFSPSLMDEAKRVSEPLEVRPDDTERLMFFGSLLACLNNIGVSQMTNSTASDLLASLFVRDERTPLQFSADESRAFAALAGQILAPETEEDGKGAKRLTRRLVAWAAFSGFCVAAHALLPRTRRRTRSHPLKRKKK